MSAHADSAGHPWAGRTFAASTTAYGDDDGSAPAVYVAALTAFHAGEAGIERVVDALREVRLLVPLVATLGEVDEHGSDKTQELALVTVAGPDGRRVLPAFSSADAMRVWNPAARPIPAPARQVALGAAGDGTELVVIDPATDRFGLRRSALEALARDVPWRSPAGDPEVGRAIRTAVATEPAVTTARVASDDPTARLDGAELLITIVLHETLDRQQVAELVERVQRRWTEDEVVRLRVDSMRVRLEAAFC